MKVPRDVNMANVKFIRVGGDAPPAAPPVTPAAPAAVDQAAGERERRRRRRARRPRSAPAAPTRTRATTRRRPRSRRGWAARRRSAGCPKQLPVMASLVESGVKNLHFGDADSVGFFQMRVGIWNKGDYAGFPEKPELQVKWFLDQAEAVKKQRIAAGKSVTDPNQFGDWIADVERPAEQYRGRYGLRLGEANGLLGQAGSRAARRGRRRRGRARARARRRPPPPRRRPSRSPASPASSWPRPPQRGGREEGRLRRRSWPSSRPPGPPSAVAPPAASVPGMVDAAAAAAPGSGASTLGASALKVAQTQLGVHESGVNTGAEVDKYLAAAERRARQPVVRELRDVVARAGRPQDAGQRLGRGPDVGPQRRGEAERPPDRQRRPGAPGRHRRLRLGPPGRLRLRRPHRLPRQQRPGRQVHRARGQQPGRRS